MKKAYFRKLLAAAFLLALVPFVWISIYSRPCADDFSYAADTYHVVQSGDWNIIELLKQAVETDVQFYNTWQGTYTSVILFSLHPGIFGEKFYFTGSILLFLLIYVCCYGALKNIYTILKKKEKPWLLALFFLTFTLVGMPDILQGIYWYNGAWHYVPFFFLTMLNVSLLLRYIFVEERKNGLLAASSLLSLLISGGNYVTGFLNILCLLFLLIPAFLRKRRKMGIPLIIAVAGYIFAAVAPGNQIRAAGLSSQPVLKTMIRSLIKCGELAIEWTNVKWICLFLLGIPVAVRLKRRLKFSCKVNPLIFLCVGLTIFCGCLCVPYISMGGFGEARVTNVFWMLYFVLSIGIAEYGMLWVIERFSLSGKVVGCAKGWQVQLVICVLLFGSFFGADIRNNNFLVASWELYNGRAKNYAQQFDERLVQMEVMKPCETLVVTPLPLSWCLRLGDITDKQEDWTNKAWKAYYGKDVILTGEPDASSSEQQEGNTDTKKGSDYVSDCKENFIDFK